MSLFYKRKFLVLKCRLPEVIAKPTSGKHNVLVTTRKILLKQGLKTKLFSAFIASTFLHVTYKNGL